MLLLRKVTQIKQSKEHSIYNVSRFVAPSLLLCQSTIGKSENDVTETIGNPDSSGLLHPTLTATSLRMRFMVTKTKPIVLIDLDYHS